MKKFSETKTVSVIGLGYIGLPTAALIATRGVKVIGVEINPAARDIINSGQPHIVEPDLDVMVRAAVGSGNLKAVPEPCEAEVFVIAVPTPFDGDKTPDLSYVESAARALAPVLKPGDLVILESTSPVGTTLSLSGWLREERADLKFPDEHGEEADILIAYCPERILPGRVMLELVENSRTVGGLNERSSVAAEAFYRIFVTGEIVKTRAEAAELVKLSENAYRDVNIAFANELSLVCEQHDINVWEVIRLANMHPRVQILSPGPGVGGHCIAVDPWFIVHSSPEVTPLIRTARHVNDGKTDHVVSRIVEALRSSPEGLVALFGLAYKPNIDDLRESPAVKIAVALQEAGFGNRLVLVEPNVESMEQSCAKLASLQHVRAIEELPELMLGVMLVAHREFTGPDFSKVAAAWIDTVGVVSG